MKYNMSKYSWILVGIVAIALGACKNDPVAQKGEDGKGEFELGHKSTTRVTAYECTLQNGYLMGVNIGAEVDSLGKRFKKGFALESLKNGSETTPYYNCKTANGEGIRIFFDVDKGKKLAKRVEYEGSLCRTDKGIGISSRLEDLLKAYPELKVKTVDKAGRVTLSQGLHGWNFVLGTEGLKAPVDLSKLNPDTRVTTISISK
jgi:hypothetical protein